MVKFIVNRIIKAKSFSLEEAWAKYSAYFIKTNIYAKYRTDVDAMLLETDNGDCILTEVTENEE